MPKNKPKSRVPKTASERLIPVNETKIKCIEHNLTDDLATKILFTMLDNYYRDGTIYTNTELKLAGRYDVPRKYVVNLWNDRSKKDTVLIRSLDEDEAIKHFRSQADARAARDRSIRSVVDTWKRDDEEQEQEQDKGKEDEPGAGN